MTMKKIRRLGLATLTVAVLATGGAVVAAPTPASASTVCPVIGDTAETKLHYGDRGWAVYKLQCMLKDIGYTVGIDGKFGQQTLNAVRRWQAGHPYLGPVDGVVGARTWASLHAGSKTY